jgi:hypothetical protein
VPLTFVLDLLVHKDPLDLKDLQDPQDLKDLQDFLEVLL